MSSLADLKNTKTLSDLGALLDIKAGMLSFQLYKRPKEVLYTKFSIPKKYGGLREISAPDPTLKLIQHRLSDLLQECLLEITKINGHVNDAKSFGISHGFKPGHTIMTNARGHVGMRYVFNLDLHDFFGSLNFGRVRGFFIKDRNFQLTPAVATVIAQIACADNKLPQGSPCSPVISNLIGHTLDIPLVRLAATLGMRYTRYADDLTFSTNQRIVPDEIALMDPVHKWIPGRELVRIIKRNGFAINESKTRMQYCDSRQEVTGLTVNHKVNVPATYRYRVRAMAHRLFTTGEFEFIYKNNEKTVVSSSKGSPQQLLGMLSYIDHVDQYNEKIKLENNLPVTETAGRTELFRQFLYFDAFFAPERPIVVCEGKTDNIYLRCAIKKLAAKYPDLATVARGVSLNVRFFKYSEQRTGSVIGLTGGVGGICKLLKHYHEDVSTRFKAPRPQHPVIVLIDNDSGANSIYEAIAGITKRKKPLGRAPFIHVFSNLYVVPTPFGPKNAYTAIEDCFDAATLARPLDGRTFSRDNKHDSSKHYGKKDFATRVVAKNVNTLNFHGFEPLLEQMVAVIKDYKTRISGAVVA
ncbi:RNA-directed DNA polymerase [Herbaspirillum seropedicae]|uniref:retron Ec67 family RNA-directed DNA polymerase/endonuclease n=1 Tax=Herbaspirillum seropedicae TaxID=964 RepID=UPI00111F2575|nr:retron Ec67 family RNA-directed DNA polymerase/endonuclease [Herbaspirillum seropedicae]QDD62698.1 RNA-directed DNA polymerase [Herbaspirillum seropedicae]